METNQQPMVVKAKDKRKLNPKVCVHFFIDELSESHLFPLNVMFEEQRFSRSFSGMVADFFVVFRLVASNMCVEFIFIHFIPFRNVCVCPDFGFWSRTWNFWYY